MIKKAFEYLILGILLSVASMLELLGWFETKIRNYNHLYKK
jgi:hypothetical protein